METVVVVAVVVGTLEEEGVLTRTADLGATLPPLVCVPSLFADPAGSLPAEATPEAALGSGGGRSFPVSSTCSLHRFMRFSSPICSTFMSAATATEGSRRDLI